VVAEAAGLSNHVRTDRDKSQLPNLNSCIPLSRSLNSDDCGDPPQQGHPRGEWQASRPNRRELKHDKSLLQCRLQGIYRKAMHL